MVANVVGWGMEMLGKGGELVGVMMGVSWRFFAGLVCQSGCSGWACVCLNERASPSLSLFSPSSSHHIPTSRLLSSSLSSHISLSPPSTYSSFLTTFFLLFPLGHGQRVSLSSYRSREGVRRTEPTMTSWLFFSRPCRRFVAHDSLSRFERLAHSPIHTPPSLDSLHSVQSTKPVDI